MAALGAVFVVTILIVRTPPGDTNGQWQSVDPLLIDSSRYSHAVAERIAAVFPGAFGRHLVTVEIEDFMGGETVPFEELNQRLESIDPRFDPFLRASEHLFRAYAGDKRYEVIYLPESGGHHPSRRVLSTILPTGSFLLPESRDNQTLVLLAAGLLASVVSLVVARRTGYLIILPAALLLYSVSHGEMITLIRLGLLLPAIVIFFETRRERHIGRIHGDRVRHAAMYVPFAFFCALSGLTVVLNQHVSSAAVDVILVVVSVFVMDVLLREQISQKILRADHQIFSPVPILKRPWHGGLSDVYQRGFAWVPAITVAAVFLMTVFGVGTIRDVQMPAPVAESSSPLDSENVLSVDGYLAHRAYQTGMMYGRAFAVPEEGETVEIERYVRKNGTVRAEGETVVSYDKAWFAAALDVRDATSLYRLILGEGQGVSIVVKRPSEPAPDREQTLLAVAMAVAAVVVPGSASTRLRIVLSAGRFSLFMKRKRQEA